MRALFLPLFLLLLAACAQASPPRLLGPPIKQGDTLDDRCTTDADCAIKDVGSCCGYQPACLNRDSPTFPERVKEECARSGSAGVCGFRDLTGCRCEAGHCAEVPRGTGPAL